MVRRRLPFLLAVALLSGQSAPAAPRPPPPPSRSTPAIPAVFSQYLAPPGKMAQVKNPGRVLFDPVAKETFVADIGNNRILVFDSNNVFRFQFFGNENITSLQDMAVTEDGMIFALGMVDGDWRIARFDYDGRFLGSLPIPKAEGQGPVDVSSMASGRNGNLFLLNDPGHELMVIDTSGRLLRRFNVARDLDSKVLKDLIYGSISTSDSLVFIPLSSLGTVAVFTQAGMFIRKIGRKGSAPGEMNFPIAVAVNGDGIVHILDKNRFNVLCFGMDGIFIGEFGGKGGRAGWFYHPKRMAINGRNQVVVAQTMNNAVQVCEPPAFLKPDTLDLQR